MEPTAETVASSAAPWISPDGAVLSVATGDAKGQVCRIPGQIGAKVRLGKSADNDLVLPDKTVSRCHAEVVRTPDGLLLRDLGSRNGTFVGDVRVREASIEPGSILTLGDVRVIVRVDAGGAVIPPSTSSSFQLAIGRSLAMRRLFGLLERVAPTDATILLTGETGTGKDVLARSIHAASARSGGPFEVVDCGAIAVNLIESELFGHEKGAFTGATATHIGAFERARGGTLFLDELGELPLSVQPKLLRVLDARQIKRLGGSRSIDVDVRVIAATMRNVSAEVEAGTFRQDLYYRLAVVPAHVPPLRERGEDIAALAEHMLARTGVSLSPEALAQLRSYEWPGNARELRNVLERAMFLARATGETTIRNVGLAGPLHAEPAPPTTSDEVFRFDDGMTYRDARARVEAEFERRFIDWILGKSGGNIAAAAREAKMDRKYLGDLVRKHGR